MLFSRFLADVILIKLGFHAAVPHELAVLMELARQLMSTQRCSPVQSCVRVLLLPRNHDAIKALTQAMAIMLPLRKMLESSGDPAASLAAACHVGRFAVASQDETTAGGPLTPVL